MKIEEEEQVDVARESFTDEDSLSTLCIFNVKSVWCSRPKSAVQTYSNIPLSEPSEGFGVSVGDSRSEWIQVLKD